MAGFDSISAIGSDKHKKEVDTNMATGGAYLASLYSVQQTSSQPNSVWTVGTDNTTLS